MMRSCLFQPSLHLLIRKREVEAIQYNFDPFFFQADSPKWSKKYYSAEKEHLDGGDGHDLESGAVQVKSERINSNVKESAKRNHIYLTQTHSNSLTSRPYCCSFSNSSGSFYYYATQDHTVTFKEYQTNETMLEFGAKVGQWTITSYDLSHNSQFLAYTSLVPYIHLASLPEISHLNRSSLQGGKPNPLPQRVLDFTTEEDDSFGLFCVKFSKDGNELVAGSNTDSIFLFDIQSNTLLHRIEGTLFVIRSINESIVELGHQSDVNSVVFMDSSSSNVIASASDDFLIKVWDKRSLPSTSSMPVRPAGVLIGHTEGITHLDAKGDGRYLISNGKDQTLKLWDIRKLSSGDGERIRLDPCPRWDYRWESYPLRKPRIHPIDSSLRTFSSHSVLRTLIRCYFSPSFTTGSRFVYTGSADGVVKIFDTLSDKVMSISTGGVVRDLSWHPFDDYFIIGSWKEGRDGIGRRGWANHGGELLHYEPDFFSESFSP